MAEAEMAGMCLACLVVYHWQHQPPLKRACCPKCSLPLARKPRGSSLGRHTTSNARPTERERRPLVMRVVEE